MTRSEMSTGKTQKFSFNQPRSFHLGSDDEKRVLKQIAEEEFSLDHLSDQDRLLVGEAIRNSGIEVHHSCVVERETEATVGAFFRRHNQSEHMMFNSDLGKKDLAPQEENGSSETKWERLYSDFAEYPYPFSEAQLLPKVIPINLSSIRNTSKSDTLVSFTAKPSKLLTAALSDRDRIISVDDLVVDFDVDPQTRRITRQYVHLLKPIRVYFGIKIRKFEAIYKFDYDSITDRNVLTSLQHSMNGRLWLAFRPNLNVESTLTYVECNGDVSDRSFLFESMEAIQNLD